MAILWFGVGDLAPIFLIFLASLFPITTAAMARRAEHPAGLHPRGAELRPRPAALFKKVIFPADPAADSHRPASALGVAWLVVVAAEMIAVNSGLGYLIIDARNAGKRYDLVVAGMAMIGLIGLALDWLIRRLESLDEVRWGLAVTGTTSR